MTEEEIVYDIDLIKKAKEIATAQVDEDIRLNENKPVTQSDREKRIEDAQRKIYGTLAARYPFDIGEVYRKKLNKVKPDLFLSLLDGTALKDPVLGEGDKGFNKFENLLDDNVSREIGGAKSWRDMSVKELKKIAEDMGYTPSDKESLGKFFDELQKAQIAYDKGVISDELADSIEGRIAAIAFPSAYEAAQRQILTDSPFDKGEIISQAILDGVVNSGMVLAPGMFNTPGRALLDATKGAGTQGAMEFFRQYGKKSLNPELDFSLSTPILAASLGLATPTAVGMTGSFLRSLPYRSAKDVGYGITRSGRIGNPVDNELFQKLENVRQFFKNKARGEGFVNTGEAMRMIRAEGILDDIKRLGVDIEGKTEEEILNIVKEHYRDLLSREARWHVLEQSIHPESRAEITELQSAFPEAMKESGEMNSARMLGLLLGQGITDIGHSILPVAKINPTQVFNVDKETRDRADEFKYSSWYDKLSEDQKAALNKAVEDKKTREKK